MMGSEQRRVDINVDVGERPVALEDGSEEQLLRLVSSANIACGGHAGDSASMRGVVKLCLALGVAIGAHPSYPDRAGFGRVKLNHPLPQLEASLRDQLHALVDVTTSLGVNLHHVKPHGALYNAAVNDRELALCIASAVASVDKSFILMGLAGSPMLELWKSWGLGVAGEAFADRRYEADGSLRQRRFADALITDPARAAEQAVRIARDGIITAVDGTLLPVDAQTLCIHGDTENAVAIAAEVRSGLLAAGLQIGPF